MLLPHVPWAELSLLNPDHLMGPPSCHSDLSLTWHLKEALPDYPLLHLLSSLSHRTYLRWVIDHLALTRERVSQEGSVLVCPAPQLSPTLKRCLRNSGLMMIKIIPPPFPLSLNIQWFSTRFCDTSRWLYACKWKREPDVNSCTWETLDKCFDFLRLQLDLHSSTYPVGCED